MVGRRSKGASGPPRFAGIDPGKEGFICVVDERCRIRAMWAIPYLENRINYAELGRMFAALKAANVRLLFLEEVHTYPKEASKYAFTSGAGYGALCMALTISKIPFEIKKAAQWKRDAEIPVPQVAKANLPDRPETKDAKRVKAWKAECKKIRGKRSREVKKRRKDLSRAKAQQLHPGYDFRSSPRAKIPHDGKCEAFLLAREAWKQARRIRDEHGHY